MTIADLRLKRSDYLRTASNILGKVRAENRVMNDAEKKDYDGLLQKVDDLDQTIIRSEKLDEMDKRISEPIRNAGTGSGGGRDEGLSDLRPGEVRALRPNEKLADYVRIRSGGSEPLSLGKAVRGMLIGEWKGAEAERRSMSESVGSLGGWLVPDSLSARVIDLARNQSVCLRAGALSFPMSGPEVTIGKLLSDPTAYWRAENAAITESDATFGPIKLKALALGCLVRVSLELLEDAQALCSAWMTAPFGLSTEGSRVRTQGRGWVRRGRG